MTPAYQAVPQWELMTEYGEGVYPPSDPSIAAPSSRPISALLATVDLQLLQALLSIEGYYIMVDSEATHVAFRDIVALCVILDWYVKDKLTLQGTWRKSTDVPKTGVFICLFEYKMLSLRVFLVSYKKVNLCNIIRQGEGWW